MRRPAALATLLVAGLLCNFVASQVPIEFKLTASDAATGDLLGSSVALSGDTALVGAPFDDDSGSSSGSAYVFVRTGITWTQQAKLTASDAAGGQVFGDSVALSGDTALVGARTGGTGPGSAYIFVRSGTTWTQQQKLTASDAAANDQFGISVALSGDTALVGAYSDDDDGDRSGSAYVFVRSGTTWSQQQKLTASDASALDRFGVSVALSEDSALVGAFGDDDFGNDSGSAYVFVRSGTTWSQQQKLTAGDAAAGNHFGFSVSLSADTALVGAWLDDGASSNTGSAYVFVRTGTTWGQQQKLTANDAAANDLFGRSVGINGNSAVVGAFLDDDAGNDSGSAYVFVRSGTTWSQQEKLIASDGAAGDAFGISVGLSESIALVGTQGSTDAGRLTGSAYVYELGETVAIQELPDIARECDDQAETATVNFIVTIDGDPPAGSTLLVTDVTGNHTLLSTTATSGDHGVGPFAFPLGASTIEVSIIDDQSEVIDETSFQAIVQDTIAPTLNGVVDQTIECNGDQTELFSWLLDISASDDCDADPGITFVPAAVGLGTTSVTVTVTDATGNTASASFLLTVEDTVPPEFDMFPDDIVRECESQAGTFVSFTMIAIDACDGVTIVCEDQDQNPVDPSGTQFGPGDHTVTCTATDSSGNSFSQSFMVSIVDTTAPVIVCPPDITIGNDPGECFAAVSFTIEATDLCDPDVGIVVTDSYGTEVMSGDAFPVGTTTLTATATDMSGNAALCSFAITVEDRDAPVLSGPTTVTLVTDCVGSTLSVDAADLGISATDNCAVDPTVSCSPAVLDPGTTSVTCTATDEAGNQSTFTTSVTVLRGPFDCLVLRPLDPIVDNRINPGRTVPVKVRVTCQNMFDAGVTATIDNVDVVSSEGTPITNDVVEDAGSANDDGNVMRLEAEDEFYIYNLSTASWDDTSGVRFRVTIRINKAGHVDTLCDVYLVNK